MKKEREEARKRLKEQVWFRQQLQMAPKFTDLVKYHAAEVNGNRVELPISGMITMEEVNEAFYVGKTDVWDVVCFLVERVLNSEPCLRGVRMEVEVDEKLGLKTIYLSENNKK